MESVEITGTRVIIGAAAVKIDLVRKRRISIGAAAARIVLLFLLTRRLTQFYRKNNIKRFPFPVDKFGNFDGFG